MGVFRVLFVGLVLGLSGEVRAEGLVDMGVVAIIESGGNPGAVRETATDRSYGLFQVSPICLKEWNNFHPQDRYGLVDLLDAENNTRIAYWYMNERLPRLLRHYKVPVTVSSLITAYNAGIENARKGRVPPVTKAYIKRYFQLKAKQGGRV